MMILLPVHNFNTGVVQGAADCPSGGGCVTSAADRLLVLTEQSCVGSNR